MSELTETHSEKRKDSIGADTNLFHPPVFKATTVISNFTDIFASANSFYLSTLIYSSLKVTVMASHNHNVVQLNTLNMDP